MSSIKEPLMNEQFVKSVSFSPAWDKRHSEPGKNYGVHCAEIRFTLKGERGAISLLVFTGWHLPHVEREWRERNIIVGRATGASVDYHSFVPLYEGQAVCRESCELLDGKPCYSDGSGMEGDRLFKLLVAEGEAAVWSELESWYQERLSKLEPVAEAI
jgi:hypothetical protein